ncbi:hypothetical protein Syun_003788 [Stephania yunnanensis]|uniref:Uncharacterized protein n=1 Tax=Stephania yunnanensis TaxID=152371 RepID=A0AAP0L241_9MAGN
MVTRRASASDDAIQQDKAAAAVNIRRESVLWLWSSRTREGEENTRQGGDGAGRREEEGDGGGSY